MGRAIFRYEDQTAKRVAGKLATAARRMRSILLAEMRQATPELAEPFFVMSPYDFDERDSYHMQDHISVSVAARGRVEATVKIEAISPESGFDYLDVTRFGNRGSLRPRTSRFLKWQAGGETHFARETEGFHPATDWVADAQPDAEARAADVAARAGRAVYTRLLR